MASFTIFCVDPRVPAISRAVLDRIEPGDTRTFTTTAIGASLGIEGELGKIGSMVEKLAVVRVNIVDHLGCAAYALAYPGIEAIREQEKHVAHLREAAALVAERFPNLEVRAFLLDRVTPEAIAPHVLQLSAEGFKEMAGTRFRTGP